MTLSIYQLTWHHISGDCDIKNHHCANLIHQNAKDVSLSFYRSTNYSYLRSNWKSCQC